MKEILRFLCMSFMCILMFSCYYDSKLWDSLHDMQGRINTLENLCQTMNGNISSLQTIISAVAQGDYIKSMKPIVEDGEDGKVPVLDIREGYWYVSYDGGSTWEQLGKATAETDGSRESFFSNVTHDEEYVYFTVPKSILVTEDKDSNNKIFYTTTDGKKMFPAEVHPANYGAILVSSIYEDGQGVLIFDADVTVLGANVFCGCTTLETIELPATVAEVGCSTFKGCTSLSCIYFASETPPAAKPDEQMSWNPFEDNAPGRKIYVPQESVEKYRDAANWASFASALVADDGTTDDGPSDDDTSDEESSKEVSTLYYTTNNQMRINSVNILEDCKDIILDHAYDTDSGIGTIVFKGKLESIVFPESLTHIGARAFGGCEKKSFITIPGSIVSIGDYAFYNTGIVEVNISDLSAWCRIDFVDDTAPKTESLYLNGGLIEDLVIPSDITEIKPNVFSGIGSISSVTIPDGVTHIGEAAFAYSRNVNRVNIPSSVVEIASDAFMGCSGIETVDISDMSAWCKIDFENEHSNPIDGALYLNGNGVTSLTLPDDITAVKPYAFNNCAGLVDLTIPENITSVGEFSFAGCGIKELTVPSNVEFIGRSTFNCSTLTTVNCLSETPCELGYAV